MIEDDPEIPLPRDPYPGAPPHGLKNTPDEWRTFIGEMRRPDAIRERERIKGGQAQKTPEDIFTHVISDALTISHEKDFYGELPESEIELYERCRDRFSRTVSEWITGGEFGKLRKLSDRVKKREKAERRSPSKSDQAKLKALSLVELFLREDRQLITQARLLSILEARIDIFGDSLVLNHRLLKEIGLNGLPRGRRGPKKR